MTTSYSCLSKLDFMALDFIHVSAILFTNVNMFLIIIEVHNLVSSLPSEFRRCGRNPRTSSQKVSLHIKKIIKKLSGQSRMAQQANL